MTSTDLSHTYASSPGACVNGGQTDAAHVCSLPYRVDLNGRHLAVRKLKLKGVCNMYPI